MRFFFKAYVDGRLVLEGWEENIKELRRRIRYIVRKFNIPTAYAIYRVSHRKQGSCWSSFETGICDTDCRFNKTSSAATYQRKTAPRPIG